LKAVTVAVLLLLVLEPGRVPLFEPDEGRYGEIPREMLASGDFVTPRLNGVLYFEKPPLHYWAVAASMALLGPTELATRLPVRAASAGMVLLAFCFARRRWGDAVGWLAALITASSALVVALARINLIDPTLSVALAGAAFSFVSFAEAEASADARRSRWALYGLHLSCAAAVMLKGLIGIVLPGGAVLVWAVLAGRLRLVPRLFSPGPLALFLLLTVPWHVAMARRHPDFLDFYFVNEHFRRFASSEHRRAGPPYYYVGVLVLGFLPWSAFLVRLGHVWPGWRRAGWRERGAEGFLIVYALLVMLFFSASRSKLIPYVLPVWPAIAVLLALAITRAADRGAAFRWERVFTGLLMGILFAGGLGVALGSGILADLGIGALPIAVMLAGFALGFLTLLAWPRRERLAERIAAAWMVFLAGALAALPGITRVITPWPLVKAALAEMRPGDVLLQFGHFVEVMPFYAQRPTPICDLGWSELDFGRAHAHQAGLFPSREEFATLWRGDRRVFVVTYRTRLVTWSPRELGLGQPRVLARSDNAKLYLLSNR